MTPDRTSGTVAAVATPHEQLVANIAAFERFQMEIRGSAGRAEILGLTLHYLRALLPVRTAGFYFPSPVELEFTLQTPLGEADARLLSQSVEQAIESGVFGWALKHPRPALVQTTDGQETLILAALRTRQRVLGMFAALLPPLGPARWDTHSTILGTYLACTADAVFSEELTSELQEHNRRLDLLVRQRTQELERTAFQLVESQHLVAGAVKIAHLLSAPADPEAALQSAVDILGKTTRSDRVWLVRHPGADGESPASPLPCLAWHSNPNLSPVAVAKPLPPSWQELLAAGQIVTAHRDNFSQAEQDWLVEQGLETILALPLLAEKTCWGYLRLDTCRTRREWSPSETYLLVSVSNNLGLVLRREQHARQLQLAKEAAEVANRAKDQFLATISHELRTPLNAILGYTQVLRRSTALPGKESAHVKTIQNSAEHLLALINDLLDLAKAQASRLELLPTEVDLETFVRETTEIVRPRAEEKGLAFACRFDPSAAVRVTVDAKRLRQVLLNLLSNAIKFTDQGSVELRVSRQDGRLGFAVADSGCGIPAADLPRLCQPFQQLGDAAQRSQGSGLGLAISKRILQALGSELRVQSQPGQGSTFSFEFACDLPLAPSSPPAEPPALVPEPALEPAWPPPEPLRVQALLRLADGGDVLALQQELERWAAESEPTHPLAGRLLTLARGFRLGAIRSILSTLPAVAGPHQPL